MTNTIKSVVLALVRFAVLWVVDALSILGALYGMYLMARAGAKFHEVAYADPEGNIHLRKFDGGVDAGDLFDGVRNQYGITL